MRNHMKAHKGRKFVNETCLTRECQKCNIKFYNRPSGTSEI